MAKYKAIINADINTMSVDEAVDIITITLRDMGLSGHITIIKENGDSVSEVF